MLRTLRLPTAALVLLPLVPGAPSALPTDRDQDASEEVEPPSRTLARAFCARPRLAGTADGRRAAEWVAAQLEQLGFEVEIESREVMLSLPRRQRIVCTIEGATVVEREDAFDPDVDEPVDVPLFSAWSASGVAEGEPIDVGSGLRADYERLAAAGIDVRGKIAVARYGGAYRGVKAELAELHGCAGLVLFNDPTSDGSGRGPVWPDGPWKPGWAAQRGAISPLARGPGDPSTPGWASGAPGEETRRIAREDMDAFLPGIPVVPAGSDDALAMLGAPPGAEVVVRLELDVPRELRTIHNVIGRLPGETSQYVVAGNHRDAWVRGAQDAGSGSISLLRAAAHLAERRREGWRPRAGVVLAWWDAEESGLIGSTEWGEAHADDLVRNAVAYVNADAAVGGLRFGASGTPGLLPSLKAALMRVEAPRLADDPERPPHARPRTVWDQWTNDGERERTLGLPGSGSDYTVFLHHLGLPVLDVSFGGAGGGQYHTRFDDFEMMDRFIDPTWEGHETAGRVLAELLAVFAERGRDAFDPSAAAIGMARMARGCADWLGAERSTALALAFDELARVCERNDVTERAWPFYRRLQLDDGLADRPWYKNRLWAPGLETGYAAESLPTLRAALAADDADALDREFASIVASVAAFAKGIESGAAAGQ